MFVPRIPYIEGTLPSKRRELPQRRGRIEPIMDYEFRKNPIQLVSGLLRWQH